MMKTSHLLPHVIEELLGVGECNCLLQSELQFSVGSLTLLLALPKASQGHLPKVRTSPTNPMHSTYDLVGKQSEQNLNHWFL